MPFWALAVAALIVGALIGVGIMVFADRLPSGSADAPAGAVEADPTAGTVRTPPPTPSPTPRPTRSPRPTATATGSPQATATPSQTARPSPTATPGQAAIPNPTVAPSPTAGAITPPTPGPVAAPGDPALPVRAAFYYAWFPEAWRQQGFDPFTEYAPSAGRYDSGNAALIGNHIDAMLYGGIRVGIASWWGIGDPTDQRMPALLQVAESTPFRWTVYHEDEGYGDPSVEQLSAELGHLRDRYAGHPGFFRLGGRFVVFVYADGGDGCAMVDRWTQANAGIGAYLVLKVFNGYRSCATQPDAWHQYAPSVAADSQAGYSYAISPGFDKPGEAPLLTRDLARWESNVRDMVASGAPFQLITTFNEWGEGTSVESAQTWATASGYGAYLDALHNIATAASGRLLVRGLGERYVPLTASAAPTFRPLSIRTALGTGGYHPGLKSASTYVPNFDWSRNNCRGVIS